MPSSEPDEVYELHLKKYRGVTKSPGGGKFKAYFYTDDGCMVALAMDPFAARMLWRNLENMANTGMI